MKKIILTLSALLFVVVGFTNAQKKVTTLATESAEPWGTPTGTYEDSRYMTLLIVNGKQIYSNYAGIGEQPKQTGLYYVLPDTITVKQGETLSFRIQASLEMKWDQLRVFGDWNISHSFDEVIKTVGEKKQGNTDVNRAEFDYTVPMDAKVGNTRIRIQYNDAWFKKDEPDYQNTAMDEILNGRVYDLNVIVKAGDKPVMQKVATPTFSPSEKMEYTKAIEVTISTETEGAKIIYTLDGSEPKDGADALVYRTPINLKAPTTIKAIAVKDGMQASEVAEITYSVKTAIEDIERNSLKVYPTSVKSVFNINYVKPATARLYSISGELLKTLKVDGVTSLDLSNFPKGVYVLCIDGQSVKIVR